MARVTVPPWGALSTAVRRGWSCARLTCKKTWSDVDREERKTITLSQAAPNATWSVDIGDRSQRQYRYAITYNLADGTRVEGASGTSDDPVISVTPFQV